MANFMHIETGSIDTREGWEASYDPEELAARGLTAAQAFDADREKTLIEGKNDEPMTGLCPICHTYCCGDCQA